MNPLAASRHRTVAELDAALPWILTAPDSEGRVEMIIRRPDIDAREVLQVGELALDVGLRGDGWHRRPSSRTPDRSPHPDMQLNLMAARVIEAIAGPRERWPLAGDQLFLDFDLRADRLPPGTRLALGAAVIEITPQPHTGCAKFVQRFGAEAMRWVNSAEGRALRLRGACARVVRPGTVAVGDPVRRLLAPTPTASPTPT